MTATYMTPDAVLVAVDISKYRHEVLIEAPNHRHRRRLTILNTKEDIDRLAGMLHAYGGPVIIGFEPTGLYHRALAFRLAQEGFDLRLVSSVSLARTREALHNGWDKNDPKDAQVILHLLRIGRSGVYLDPTLAGLDDIQELSKTHEVVSRGKTEIWHRILTHYLPLYFPEAERFKGKSRSDWFLALLETFPTPASIVSLGKEGFIEAAWSVVGKKVSKRRLLGDIYETASQSIALPAPSSSAAVEMFRLVLGQARGLVRQRDLIEERANALLGDDRQYQLLKTIPGIGPINALTIIAEAGDLRRFRHHRQFLKFCGLDLATHQSGTFRGQSKLSKFGNARLRRTFWMAGQVAIRQRDNGFRDKYERYIARDRTNADLRRKALTAVAAKVARTAHAVVKTDTEYRPFFEGREPSGRTPLCRSRGGAATAVAANS